MCHSQHAQKASKWRIYKIKNRIKFAKLYANIFSFSKFHCLDVERSVKQFIKHSYTTSNIKFTAVCFHA